MTRGALKALAWVRRNATRPWITGSAMGSVSCRIKRHALIVNGIASVDLPEKIEGGAQTIVSFVDRNILRSTRAFGPDDTTWERLRLQGIIDRTLLLAFHPNAGLTPCGERLRRSGA